jgi:hypothetical protein
MKHTVEIYTPIEDEVLGAEGFYQQTIDSKTHREVMKDVNETMREILEDNFKAHVGKIHTSIVNGDPAHLDEDENIATELCIKYKHGRK